MVKDYVAKKEFNFIKEIIASLKDDFTLSSNPNSRKGGLVGLAAAAIALGRVRYYYHGNRCLYHFSLTLV